MTLEVCAYNIQSCIIAQEAGAARIELCADPGAGGTTPSYGLLQYAIEHISVPVFPMIRPRGGDFIYDEHELEIMQKDILACRRLGYTGIVTGVQLPDGRIDTEQLKRLVACAKPMTVTCHKVFDAVPDAFVALESVIAAGCRRILTSGLEKTAIQGSALLKQLITKANGRIIIMPGGGVRSSNIAQLAGATGAVEYHTSGIVEKTIRSTADEGEISSMVRQLKIIAI